MRVEISAGPKFDRVLKAMAHAYESAQNREALAVPDTITCAAALEAKLNDAIARHVDQVCGAQNNAIRLAFMSMSFRGKLETLPLLLTSNKFRLNHSNEVVQRLLALIGARNQLVHPKPSSHEVTREKFDHPIYKNAEFFAPGTEFWDLLDDLSFGVRHAYQPEEYHDAVDKLEKWFFKRLPDRVSKIALLTPNDEA